MLVRGEVGWWGLEIQIVVEVYLFWRHMFIIERLDPSFFVMAWR